jgi:hypothetical protein
MSLGNLFGSGDKETIAKEKFIEITKKTVRFGASVFQWENVTGFRLAKVRKKIVFPIWIISSSLLLGLLLLFIFAITTIQSVQGWGIMSCLVAVAGIVVNAIQPKRHGLELSLNSSERVMFVTHDLNGVKEIVAQLYEFMESERDSTYTINIDQSRATIGVGYAETLNTKSVSGTTSDHY